MYRRTSRVQATRWRLDVAEGPQDSCNPPGLASDGTSYPLHCTWNVAISRFSVGGPSRMIFPVTLNRWAVLDLIAVLNLVFQLFIPLGVLRKSWMAEYINLAPVEGMSPP
jgi:hypothetical protein